MAEKQELITIERDGQELEVDERRFRLFYKPLGWVRQTVKELTKTEVIEELKKREVNFDPKAKVADLRSLLDDTIAAEQKGE
ncbi:hypothetical protein [Exiguobacterium sp. s138]|uniref:hypothetical protein n=1 Tax=Exiguobacterium sp. s138 TaxID=2751202 RepID=UPI001BEB263D|nr:hypothetical protein [Exiguobacterium sp. s138]